jgi:galactose mutarotase-like enzyme
MRLLFLTIAALYTTALFSQTPAAFQKNIDGKPVSLYTLKNSSGMQVQITNYGGRIVSLSVPDRKGKIIDVVAGYAAIDGYLGSKEVYHGATIGRYANRIGGAQFKLDGKTYNLPANNGPNTLHGGQKGFHNQVWDVVQHDEYLLMLQYQSKDGEEGFPGNLNVLVTFSLSAYDNELRIEYEASTDKPTVVNLTNHAFFNLSGEGDKTVGDHLLRILGRRISPVDANLIPNAPPVYRPAFDFARMQAIGARLGQNDPQLKLGNGYDHNYVLDEYVPGTLRLGAIAYSPKSGISMELRTTEPGIQFYGGNFLDGSDRGKSGKPYLFRALFCLEPQHFPNSPNDKQQPSTTLRPGDRYYHADTYRFSNDATYTTQPAPAPLEVSATVGQWTAEQANNWYKQQPWRVGANFVPAYAINQLEMLQTESFDTVAIERELRLAAGIGMNTMRIFLHDLLWRKDPADLKQKLNTVLRICARNGIVPIIVFFDSVWNGEARLGKQKDPTPGVHNSYWVKSPNLKDLCDPSLDAVFEAYVYDVVSHFRNDPRIFAWDIWNEPDNTDDRRAEHGMSSRDDQVAYLLPRMFAAARRAKPTQPLTSGVWKYLDTWGSDTKLNPIQRAQLQLSDVISFHCYADSATFEGCVANLKRFNRPLICTEYLARSMGSTFEKILPIGKKYNIAMINWGLVQGKTQTHFPWDSWQEPYTKRTLPVWHHEVFKNDGTPYRNEEVELIRRLLSDK